MSIDKEVGEKESEMVVGRRCALHLAPGGRVIIKTRDRADG